MKIKNLLKNKPFITTFFLILVFGVLVSLSINNVFAFHPCDTYTNLSYSDYYDCRSFYDNLNSTSVIQNNITVFRNITNEEVSYVTNNVTNNIKHIFNYTLDPVDIIESKDFDLRWKTMKLEFKDELLDYFEGKEIVQTVRVNDTFDLMKNPQFLELVRQIEDKDLSEDDSDDNFAWFFDNFFLIFGGLGVAGYLYSKKKKDFSNSPVSPLTQFKDQFKPTPVSNPMPDEPMPINKDFINDEVKKL